MWSEPAAEPPLSPEGFQALLSAALPGFGMELPETVAATLAAYLAELDAWRKKINLTGNLSSVELVTHTLESLLANDLIAHGARVVDIGSGAGFPGLPIAIARPDLHMTLVEPRRKKCAFLRHVARTLGLANVSVFEGRVQEVGGQTFHTATTRALGDIALWLGQGRLLAPGGSLLAWTTAPDPLATDLAGTLEEARLIPIPGSDRRSIVVFRKP
jgi:16S rRNA (guanine527-N7)-methyltransferase